VGTLVDTSVLIAAERGARAFAPEEEHAIAAITAAELLHGVHRASAAERVRREAFVEGLLAQVPVVPFTLAVARVHARIWAELAAKGRVRGAHDLLIAATALALDWPLLTLDRHGFARIRGLRLADAP
jgi:predicted nucleic acid-binding protein